MIKIRGVPFSMGTEDLSMLFEEFGAVEFAQVSHDRNGIGYVLFADHKAAVAVSLLFLPPPLYKPKRFCLLHSLTSDDRVGMMYFGMLVQSLSRDGAVVGNRWLDIVLFPKQLRTGTRRRQSTDGAEGGSWSSQGGFT